MKSVSNPAAFCVLNLLLAATTLPSSATAGTLYFLNTPERVVRPSLLAHIKLPRGKFARVFFHYQNGMRTSQTFRLATSGSLDRARWSCAEAFVPGHAGSDAGEHFAWRKAMSRPIRLRLSCRVAPGMVISGIVEGIPHRAAALDVAMGSGSATPVGRVRTTSLIAEDYHFTLSSSHCTRQIRIGTPSAGYVAGGYGRTFRVHVQIQRPGRMRVVFSPRGGHMRFIYRHNGAIHILPGCLAQHWYELFSAPVYKNDTIEVSPIGGYCYPIQLSYRLLPGAAPHHSRTAIARHLRFRGV